MPVKRIRDGTRFHKPQSIITAEEWEDIVAKAAAAEAFLAPNSIPYLSLRTTLQQAEDIILENRLREVREEHVITETFKKVFITPKKIQDDEVVGQIKLLRSFFAELQSWIELKETLEQREADGTIKIERSKE